MKPEETPFSNLYFVCFAVALVATLGSLFFSEIMGFAPCSMCWYQRIFMYPLVWIFFKGIFDQDSNVHKYSLPLSITGLLFSIYQLLLYFEIIPEEMAPCTAELSCTSTYIQWLGFITIPMLSFAAFSAITAVQVYIILSNKTLSPTKETQDASVEQED